MAIYRNVHVSFWEDTKVLDDMTPEDRYFMLYILTNPHTNQIGCYEIGKRQISNETGYSIETIENLITRHEEILKTIRYSKTTKELLILNWFKYNWTTSPKVKVCIKKELETIKDKEFKEYLNTVCIPYIYPMDTHPQEEQEQEEEQKKEQEDIYVQKFLEFYNLYPKKQKKQEAEKWFVKNKPNDDLYKKMIVKLEKFKETDEWKKEGGIYVPMPITWLNQKRWEDEIEVKESGANKGNIGQSRITEGDRELINSGVTRV